MDEITLISNIKHNPTDGLKQAFSTYGPLVKAVTVKVLGSTNSRDVEECIADTFIKLWQSIDSYNEGKGTLKSYIIGISRHVAVDRYRKICKNSEIALVDENETALDLDMESEVTRILNQKIVKDTIDSLPETDRKIFIRRYYLVEKVNEIAARLGLKSKYVEKRLYKGKRKLQKELLERGIIL